MDFGEIMTANLELLFIGVGIFVVFYVFIYPLLKMAYVFISEVGN